MHQKQEGTIRVLVVITSNASALGSRKIRQHVFDEYREEEDREPGESDPTTIIGDCFSLPPFLVRGHLYRLCFLLLLAVY